jgi:hypothetical protein
LSSPDDIDALAVARRLLATPTRFRATDREVLAMAGCLIGLDQQIDALEHAPPLNARLAAAVASVLLRHDEACRAQTNLLDTPAGQTTDALVDANRDARLATHLALNVLKTIFEKEFAHVGS